MTVAHVYTSFSPASVSEQWAQLLVHHWILLFADTNLVCRSRK